LVEFRLIRGIVITNHALNMSWISKQEVSTEAMCTTHKSHQRLNQLFKLIAGRERSYVLDTDKL